MPSWCLFTINTFWDRVSCRPGWPGIDMQPLHPAPSLYLPSSESVGMHYYAMNENLVLEIESRLYARQANTLLTELHSQLHTLRQDRQCRQGWCWALTPATPSWLLDSQWTTSPAWSLLLKVISRTGNIKLAVKHLCNMPEALGLVPVTGGRQVTSNSSNAC